MSAATALRAASQSRRLLGPLMRAWYRIEVDGAPRFPAEGPVLVVANHPGALDLALLMSSAPRPVRVLDADQVLMPSLDRMLNATGRIRCAGPGPDWIALRRARRTLEEAQSVGVLADFDHGDGAPLRVRQEAAYLAMRTGAAVLPTAVFGSRTPGMAVDALPRRRSPLVVVFGVPFSLPAVPDVYRRRAIRTAAETMRQRLTDHVAAVQPSVGIALPSGSLRPVLTGRRDRPAEQESRDHD